MPAPEPPKSEATPMPKIGVNPEHSPIKELIIKNPVGIGKRNDANDVLALSTLLAAFFKSKGEDVKPTSEATADFKFDIQRFQKEKELKVDGVANPNGETIDAIKQQTNLGAKGPDLDPEVTEKASTEEQQSAQQITNNSGGDNIEGVINDVNQKWPNAKVRITGRARTIRRQAELMAKHCRNDRKGFLSTYTNHQYILDMADWVKNNPDASITVTENYFEAVIRQAIEDGYKVSNHLSDNARDVSVPKSDTDAIRSYIESKNISVLDESGKSGAPHWHLDYK